MPPEAGVDDDAVALTRRAGHVHDLGRIGVSNQIWSKPNSLSAAEFERVRLHPYFTVRILNQVPGLAQLAEVAGNHHECLDGSGYPRALAGSALGLPDRILAAAVSYQSACEPRPYRKEMPEIANGGLLPGCRLESSMLLPSMRCCTRPATVPSGRRCVRTGSLPGRSRCCVWSLAVHPIRKSPRLW